MTLVIEQIRRQEKILTVSGQEPTVPALPFDQYEEWGVTDLIDGEICVNNTDKKFWFRLGNEIVGPFATLANVNAAKDYCDSQLTTEAQARASADTTLQGLIDGAYQDIGQEALTRSNAINNEAQIRSDADDLLQTGLSSEISTRTSQVNTLTTGLSNEQVTRGDADIVLQSNINIVDSDLTQEILKRESDVESLQNADADLQTGIDKVSDNLEQEITDRTDAINGLLDGVSSPGDTLKKLYDLIVSTYSEVTVANIAARNAYNITKLPTNIFVTNDGDGNWALYKATTTGTNATYIKISDPDLLNAVMSASQIKTAYESNADTNAFTNALLAKLNAIASGATANSSDAFLLARANHTGTQDAVTISGTKTSSFISDFVSTVRSSVLTGIDLATNAAITASDSVLSAFGKLQKQLTDLINAKDASGGYAGLTLFKINFRNVANTFTSFFTNSNTAARTYTFPDKDLTVIGTEDIVNDLTTGGTSKALSAEQGKTLQTNKENTSNKDATGGYAGLTLFKINFKNTANSFTSFLSNVNTAARTYLFPDKDGTVALTNDLPTLVRLTADKAVTGLTATEITDGTTAWNFAIGIGEFFEFECYIPITTSGSSGAFLNITFPVGASTNYTMLGNNTTATSLTTSTGTASNTNTSSFAIGTFTANAFVMLKGTILNPTNAGTVSIRIGDNNSGQTVTCKAGATFKYKKA